MFFWVGCPRGPKETFFSAAPSKKTLKSTVFEVEQWFLHVNSSVHRHQHIPCYRPWTTCTQRKEQFSASFSRSFALTSKDHAQRNFADHVLRAKSRYCIGRTVCQSSPVLSSCCAVDQLCLPVQCSLKWTKPNILEPIKQMLC